MWFLEQNTIDEIRGVVDAGHMPNAEQEAEFAASRERMNGAGSRVLEINGNTAEISITGTLTKKPSLFMSMFGGGNTAYPEIVSALDEAENNPEIKNIDLLIDSPGGYFAGLFDALGALQSTTKPMRALVSDMAASAAYAIASQADQIVALNKSVRVGSIGVAATFIVWDDEVDIASTLAPKKRPDVTTDEGKAIVREELDALHELFVEAISEGRGKTADVVNKSFGQGATLLAEEALRRGMIDAIQKPEPPKIVNTQKQEERAMDLRQLQADHPDIYEAAVKIGIEQERDRVAGHLVAGKNSGAMDVAIKAIEDGEMMTQKLTATYMTIARNGNDLDDRQADDQTLGAADGADTDRDENAEADQVANLVRQKLGIQEVSHG